MHSLASRLLLLIAAGLVSGLCPAASFSFQVTGADRAAWAETFESVGLTEAKQGSADVVVLGAGSTGDYRARVERGAIVVLEGDSPVAASFGIRGTAKQVSIRSITDARAPKLGIVWEETVSAARFELPAQATVFAREKWEQAPVLAGFRQGSGAVLWLALAAGLAVLRINTRGHDGMTQIPGRKGSQQGGATWERISDCTLDLAAWLSFLQSREASRVALVGHSMGGLVLRSACYYASEEGLGWLAVPVSILAGELGSVGAGGQSGRILVAGACTEGSGGPEFTRLLGEYPDADSFLKAIEDTPVTVDQWQLEKLALVARRTSLFYCVPGLAPELRAQLWGQAFATLPEAVTALLEGLPEGATIAVIPEGPYVLAQVLANAA